MLLQYFLLFLSTVYGFKSSNFARISKFDSKLVKAPKTLVLWLNSEPLTKDSDTSAIIGLSGVLSNVVVDYSLYTLKTTGSGLPAGDYGIEGGIEGISYLGIIGIAIWSLYTKVKTGSGLPAGKFGLLGAAEGLSYLSIVIGIVVAVLNILDYGYITSNGVTPN